MIASAEDIVKSFDEILDFVFGRSRGRDYQHKTDIETATEWIERGITLPVACCVFYHQISRLHENWLRQIDHRDRKNIPTSLKLFDEYILSAIDRVKAGGEPIALWEQAESQWSARIRSWSLRKVWLREMWGPAPGEDGCRCPARLLSEEKKNA